MKLYKLSGWLITPLVYFLAKRNRRSSLDLKKKQADILLQLIKRARHSQFGIDHVFGKIHDIPTYQARVPIRTYEQFVETYWKAHFPILENVTWPGRINYFAKSSGTISGMSKFIPCTQEMIKSNNRAGMQVILEHFKNYPRSKILQGRYFMFAGSPNLEELAPGIHAGELSGIAAKETPAWAGRDRYYPPAEIAAIRDWETKLQTIADDSLDKDIRAIGGLPSWLLILFKRISTHSLSNQIRLSDWFPDLQLIVHGGMSFEPYRQSFLKMTEGLEVDFREVYAASEGFFAVSDRGHGEGMRLIADNGIFYEFIPLDRYHEENPPRYWLGTVVPHVDYVLIVTTNAGLWSYIVGDIIRFVDIDPFRLIFSGRLSQTLSMFGEKILNEEIEAVLRDLATQRNVEIADYSVYSHFDQGKGRHLFLLECLYDAIPEAIESMVSEIDVALQEINTGYATRRKNNVGILRPSLAILQPGTFSEWMERKGKAGGQHKVPRIVGQAQVDELLTISKRRLAYPES